MSIQSKQEQKSLGKLPSDSVFKEGTKLILKKVYNGIIYHESDTTTFEDTELAFREYIEKSGNHESFKKL